MILQKMTINSFLKTSRMEELEILCVLLHRIYAKDI